MSGRATIVVAVVVVTGCTRGAMPPVDTPQPPSVDGAPVKIAIETEPEPRFADRCRELASLTEAGEHKPAVDLLARLEAAGAPCPEHQLAAAEESRRRLESADDLIRSSTARKQTGDVRGAIQDLRQALEIYPKYYWARKLLRDLGERPPDPEAEVDVATGEPATVPAEVPGTGSQHSPRSDAAIQTDVEVLRQLIAEQNLDLARIAEQQGDLAAASRWAMRAMKAEPGDSSVMRAVVEYVRLLGLKFFSAGELTPARELWVEALALDRSDQRLQDYLRQVDERLESLEQIRNKGGS